MGIPSDWGGTSTTRRCLLVFTSISFCHLARAQLFAARDLSSLEPQGSSVSECSLSCCRIYHPSETQHLFFTRGWFGHCANLQMEEGFFIRHQNIPFLGAYYYCASASGLRSFFFHLFRNYATTRCLCKYFPPQQSWQHCCISIRRPELQKVLGSKWVAVHIALPTAASQ